MVLLLWIKLLARNKKFKQTKNTKKKKGKCDLESLLYVLLFRGLICKELLWNLERFLNPTLVMFTSCGFFLGGDKLKQIKIKSSRCTNWNTFEGGGGGGGNSISIVNLWQKLHRGHIPEYSWLSGALILSSCLSPGSDRCH